DILRAHIGDYQKQYKLHPDHYKVVYDIMNCRTEYLGGHVERCDHCGVERTLYNSCRNRHCPKCQTLTKEKWLAARKAELLKVAYFHVVFTLPHELNPVILCNKRIILTILFQAVSATLLAFGRNPENGLYGTIGFIAVLHTWDQQLNDHFHLHCLVPAGALSANGKRWIACPDGYLFPEKALSIVFRAKFMEQLQRAYAGNKLRFPGETEKSGTRQGFRKLTREVWSKQWVVDIKEPIRQPEYVLEYLGRYTHRVAISNSRIIGLENGKVSFFYKNRKKQTTETMTLDAVEFIRRFLLHVLPKGFMRIRHFGFFANRVKKDLIRTCRLLLETTADLPETAERSLRDLMLTLTGTDISKCPACQTGTMRRIMKIPEGSGLSAYRFIQYAN
ncbi:MAG: IS91 family transposase, partial [Candidatus Zhuqueibacterota bacterium]